MKEPPDQDQGEGGEAQRLSQSSQHLHEKIFLTWFNLAEEYVESSHLLYTYISPITTYCSQLLSSFASPLMGTRVTPGWTVYLGGWVEGTLAVR